MGGGLPARLFSPTAATRRGSPDSLAAFLSAQVAMRVVTIMRQRAPHFAVLVKFHHLRRQQSVNAAVFQNTTPHTGVKPDEVEPQRRIRLQPAREVIAQRRLA